MSSLMELNETVKEALAVFIAACRLGFDPESEIGAGKGPNGEAIIIVKRRSTDPFIVGLGHPTVTWAYFLESWKDTTQKILRGQYDADKVAELFESSVFRLKLPEFVDGLIENGLLQLEDIRNMNARKQNLQAGDRVVVAGEQKPN